MKRIITTVFVLSIASAAMAQGFYLRTGLGYAFAQAGQTIDGTATPYNGSFNNNTQAYSIKSASFSAGVQGYVGIGYMFNNNVGVQMDVNLGVSPKKYSFKADNVNLGGYTGSVTYKAQATSPVIMMPALVLQSGGDTWNIYSRFGLALPLDTKITQDQIQANAPNTGAPTVDDFTFTVTNSFSLGFAGAAGVRYKLSDRISLWAECSLLSMSVYIKKSELTDVTRNGQGVPLSAVSGNLVVNYSKNITADSAGANMPAYSQPFSNVAINAGVTFNLSRNSGRHSSGRRHEDVDNKKPFRRR
jgi:Outer membrane protein beta-barrel domain